MKNTIGRLVLLVNEYEEALDFYRRSFGFDILFDQENPETGNRFLHIGFKDASCRLWLMKAGSAREQQAVGNQTAGNPFMVIYTDDLAGLHKRLKDNGTEIRIGPVDDQHYSFLHCFDLYGNEIIVVQLHPHPNQVTP